MIVFLASQGFFGFTALAQTPQYSWGIADGNIALTSTVLSRKRQSLYPESDFAGLIPGNITTIYMKRFTTTAVNIPSFSVRLGTTTATVFPGTGGSNNSAFFSTAVVYSGSLSIPAGTAGSWVAVNLQTPYFYNGVDNLVVEFRLGTASANFNLYRTTRTAGGATNTDTSSTVASQNNYPYDIGFDVTPVPNSPPVVDLVSVQNITHNSADLTGEILYDGGSPVLRKGFIWSLSPAPVLGTTSTDSIGVIHYNAAQYDTLWNTLAPGNRIYLRAFAENANGTGYSQTDSFFTLSSPPPAHIHDLSYIPVCSEIVVSWDSIPGVSGYLVAYTPLLVLSQPPQNRTMYAAGNVLGNGFVADVMYGSNSTQAVITGLTPGVQYRVAVFPFNYNGANTETIHYLTAAAVQYTVNAGPLSSPLPSDTVVSICEGDTVQLAAATGYGTVEWLDADTNFLFAGNTFTSGGISSDTTFFVRSAVGSCYSEAVEIAVTSFPYPVAIASADTMICAGNSVALADSVSPGALVSWTGVFSGYASAQPQPVIVPTQPDMYRLVVTDPSGGCRSTDSVTVTVLDLPVPPVITVNGNTLQSSYFSGIQWYFDGGLLPGETSQLLVPQAEGEYVVVYADPNGCSASDTIVFFFTGIAGENGGQFSIYPNPFAETFRISGLPGQAVLEVWSSAGQLCLSRVITEDTAIDAGHLPAGLYLYRIVTNGSVQHGRLIRR